MRIVLEVAGISNILSKSLGSSNKINVAYATVAALQTIEPSSKWVTRQSENNEKKKESIKIKAEAK